MRTSVEISDALLARARQAMGESGVTLRSLVEEGLRRVLDEHRAVKPFRMREAAFPGPSGFAPGASDSDIRRVIEEEGEGRRLP